MSGATLARKQVDHYGSLMQSSCGSIFAAFGSSRLEIMRSEWTSQRWQESEEARRLLESEVRRLELRWKAKEGSDQARDEEVSGLVKEVQALHISVQRMESQWEKANGRFNKLGVELASCSSKALECLSGQSLLESRLDAVSKCVNELESEQESKLERLGGQEFRVELDALKAEREKWSQWHDNEQRRSVENLQRRMQSMQVALETMAELRQEDRKALEELKRFRYELVEKMNDFQMALEESQCSFDKLGDLELYLKDVALETVKMWTKEASRELRERLHVDFQAWVKDWERSFQHELPQMERQLKKQLWALKD